MNACIYSNSEGSILYDADAVPSVVHAWFDAVYWQHGDEVARPVGGRGSAWFIDTPAGPALLRHYRRGGMVADVLGDRYLWTGRDTTRSFSEFRLLAWMREHALPVPAPLAARCVRSGIRYTADLITQSIDATQTLAECLHDGSLDADLARRSGGLIATFHAHGVWHADLNAGNILVTADALYLIDFDRGRLRQPARAWQQANLSRLQRSLYKLGAARDGEDQFRSRIWQPLMAGYERTLEQLT